MPEVLGGYRPDVPATERDELERIMQQQEIEQHWWGNQPTMETVADIDREVETGRASRIPDQGVGYKISANVKPEFRVLERSTAALMEQVAVGWLDELQNQDIDSTGLNLIITSLARTSEYQKELIARGFPAAENSTHVKLGAFDIGIKWFEQNRPELLKALMKVVYASAENNELNAIEEPTVGALHIALNRLNIH